MPFPLLHPWPQRLALASAILLAAGCVTSEGLEPNARLQPAGALQAGRSLEIAPGQRLVDSPEFPEQWKQGALGAADALDQLRGEQRLDWVFLSPAMLLEPGQRSGKFRLGGDQVLFDAKGESRISLEDLAVAMLDEAEQPRHHRQRFTVAY